MRLFEIKRNFGSLPDKAGVAVLDWGKDGPMRDGKTIKLPAYTETQFFPLRDGAQFLLQIPGRDRARVFFGGTDEQPFLVELDLGVVASLHNSEEEFFNLIKPNGVKVLEEAFDTKAVRQGDWFAVPVPLSWKVTCGMIALVEDPMVIEPSNEEEREVQLLETRHSLISERHINMWRNDNRLECALVGEGILRAPNREDRVLKGPHMFFRTAYLVNS